MKALVPIREALADPDLLGMALPGDSWRPWRVLLIAAMGEPLDDDERAILLSLTGLAEEPLQQVDELWGVGRTSWRKDAGCRDRRGLCGLPMRPCRGTGAR